MIKFGLLIKFNNIIIKKSFILLFLTVQHDSKTNPNNRRRSSVPDPVAHVDIGRIVWIADLRPSRCIGFIDFDPFPSSSINGEPPRQPRVRPRPAMMRPLSRSRATPLTACSHSLLDGREITTRLEKWKRVCYSKNAGCKSKPDTIYLLYKENSETTGPKLCRLAPSGSPLCTGTPRLLGYGTQDDAARLI